MLAAFLGMLDETLIKDEQVLKEILCVEPVASHLESHQVENVVISLLLCSPFFAFYSIRLMVVVSRVQPRAADKNFSVWEDSVLKEDHEVLLQLLSDVIDSH